MNEIRPLKEEDKELFCSFPPCQNAARRAPRKRACTRQQLAGTLILGVSGLQNGRKCISVVDKPLPPQVMVSVTAAKAKMDGKRT